MKIGRHRIYRADCMTPGILDRVLGSVAVDAVVTDCAYNVSKETPGTRLRRTDYGEWDHRDGLLDVLVLLDRLKTVPTWLVSCSDLQLSPILEAMRGRKRMTRTGVWLKTNPSVRNGQLVPLSSVEVAAFGRLPKAWWGGHCQGLEWTGAAPHHTRRLHTTQKPLGLLAHWVKLVCPEGGVVLDPFLGSGTTLLACEATGRTCIGFDSDPTMIPDVVRTRFDRIEDELGWAKLV